MRAKIILPNFIAVLLLGLGSYFYLKGDLQKKANNNLNRQIQITSSLFERSEALRGFDLLNNVRSQAMSKNMVKAFAPVQIDPIEGETQEQTDKRVHAAWFKECLRAVEAYSKQWREQKGKRPELIVLTDRKGAAIVRNITPNACPAGHNIGTAMPVVNRALDGEATYSIWSIDDSPLSSKKQDANFCQLMNTGLLELSAAPVWYEDNIAGSLVIGFEISNGIAKKNAELLGLDVAVLKNGKVYSSSMTTDTARQSLEQQLSRPDVQKRITEAVQKGIKSDVFEISVEGEPFLAQTLPVHTADKKDQIASLVFGSVEDATADLNSLNFILVALGVALLLVFIIGMMLTYHFLKPIMAIEEGILKVINGEFQYRFDVKSSEVGGLSYRINQMIGALTGEDEESDMGDDE